MPRKLLEDDIDNFFRPTIELLEAPEDDKDTKKSAATSKKEKKSDDIFSGGDKGDQSGFGLTDPEGKDPGDKDQQDDIFGAQSGSEYSLTDIGKVFVLKKTFSTIGSLIGYAQDILKQNTSQEVEKLVKNLIDAQDYLYVVANNIDKYLTKIDTILDLYTKLIKQTSKILNKYSQEIEDEKEGKVEKHKERNKQENQENQEEESKDDYKEVNRTVSNISQKVGLDTTTQRGRDEASQRIANLFLK